MKTISVHHLITMEEHLYVGEISEEDALVSTYMLHSGMMGSFQDETIRQRLKDRISYGKHSMGLGDLAVYTGGSDESIR